MDQASSLSTATARHGRATGKRRSAILIVGEETDALARCARSLNAHGYAVDFAQDEPTVERLSREKDFDVILNDIDTPNGCHGESLRNLRKQDRRVPVVVLSGCLAFASARAALACGAHKYLVKPVSDERLVQVLVSVMRDAASRPH